MRNLWGLLMAGCLAGQEGPVVIDVHQHFSSRANYFEELDRVYRASNVKACVNGFIADLKAFKDAAFKGIKIHSPQKIYDDGSYFPIYGRAQQLGFVMLFHSGVNNRGDPSKVRNTSFMRMRPGFLSTLARFPS